MSNNSLRRSTAMDLLKRLWDGHDKKPACEAPAPDVKTDIYSIPATRRRIIQRPRPLK